MFHPLTSHRRRTRRGVGGFVLALISVLLLLVQCEHLVVGYAQELGGVPRLAVPDKTPDVLTPGIRPDAIIMRNGMGESVFVPKSKYEEFERFLGSENASPTDASVDVLERLNVSVTVDNAIARLKVEAQANLFEANQRWLSVPIAMGSVQAIPTRGSKESSIEFPPIRISVDSSGYIWRVSPGPQGVRKLEFGALSNLRSSAQGQSLRLDLPLVPTIVRFELPAGEWEFNAVGNGSEVVEPIQEIGSSSIAVTRTSGGSITFNWAKKTVADQIQAIEVESQTKYVPLVETGEFRAVSNVAIRGPKTLGGRRFQITLPERSQWRERIASPISFPGYRFGRADVTPGNASTVLFLEFEEAFSRTEIELPIEWQTSISPESSPIAFSMPRVEGIQRHYGTVDLVAPRNVSFQWEPQAGIQFAKQSQSSDGSETLTYSFRFNQQTEPLMVYWSSGDRASDLKASYNVIIDSSGMRLSGTIDILGDVRQLPFLQLDVRGWTVDRVQLQPSGRDLDLIAIRSRSTLDPDKTQQNTTSIPLSLGELLDALPFKNGAAVGNRTQAEAMQVPTDAGVLIPLLNAREENMRQPTRSISFVLTRSSGSSENGGQFENLESSKRPIGFSLPMLSWLDPESQQRLSLCVGAELTIQSSVERLSESDGLPDLLKRIGESNSNPIDTSILRPSLSISRNSLLRYRVAKSKSWLDWTGTAEMLGTTIQGNAQTDIALTTEGLDISQTWNLICNGALAKTLRIAVPKEWMEEQPKSDGRTEANSSLEIVVDNVSVSPNQVQGKIDGLSSLSLSPSLEQRYLWFQITLPDKQGAVESTHERKIVLHKRMMHRDRLLATPTAFDWLLPWIAADKQDDSVIIVKFAGSVLHEEVIHCVVHSPIGGLDETVPAVDRSRKAIRFDRTQLEPRLVGNMSLMSVAKETDFEMESVWLQTIVNESEQRDRFVVRLKTRASSVSLSLPANRIANGEFLINGRKVIESRNPYDINRVDLPLDTAELNSASGDKVYVLEVFLWSSNKSHLIKTLHADLPTIIDCRSRAPMIWQVVVPTSVHLIGNTSTLSPGYRWKWRDLWFGRTSDWTQESIGSQIGASAQRFVSQQSNQYVFFSLDHTVDMKVWMAPRYLLWAPVALFVLIGSFFVMEFRWVRKPWISILLLLSSLAFSQWAWDLSIALVQCFVAAIGIAVLYSTLKWVVDRRARRRSVFASRPSSPLIPSAVRATSLSGSVVLPKPVVATVAPPAIIVTPESPPSTTNTADAEGGK